MAVAVIVAAPDPESIFTVIITAGLTEDQIRAAAGQRSVRRAGHLLIDGAAALTRPAVGTASNAGRQHER